jgi:hypothetical protein
MPDWYCFKDKEKMINTSIRLSYMMLSQRVPGLKCPVCGTEYLSEEFVMTTVKEAESLLEGK